MRLLYPPNALDRKAKSVGILSEIAVRTHTEYQLRPVSIQKHSARGELEGGADLANIEEQCTNENIQRRFNHTTIDRKKLSKITRLEKLPVPLTPA